MASLETPPVKMKRARTTTVAFAHFKKLLAPLLRVKQCKFVLTKTATQALQRAIERVFLGVLVDTARRGRPVTMQAAEVQRARYFLRLFAGGDCAELAPLALDKLLPRQLAVKALKEALLPRKKRVTRAATAEFRLFFLDLLNVAVHALQSEFAQTTKTRLSPEDVTAALATTPCFQQTPPKSHATTQTETP